MLGGDLLMYRILIQLSERTGRFHPCYYRMAPLPGNTVEPMRYKSGGHHTEGFKTLEEAQENAATLAAGLRVPVEVPEEGFPVRVVAVEGADVFMESRSGVIV
jgi:hypothetical protein